MPASLKQSNSQISMKSSTSGTSQVSAKNRPTEYRRNWIGTVLLGVVLASYTGCFLYSIYCAITDNKVTEVLVLRVLLVFGYAFVVGNLAVALLMRGFGMKLPYVKYLPLLLSAIIIPVGYGTLF